MIKEIETFKDFLRNGTSLRNRSFQEIDFSTVEINWDVLEVDKATFLGCTFKKEDKHRLFERGALILSNPQYLPYNPLRKDLYNWQELLKGDATSIDEEIYNHFESSRRNPPVVEALWQRVHDHSMDDALREFIGTRDDGSHLRKCVGVMGGHSTKRDDLYYTKVARICKSLAEKGYLVVSGGGPGIMEAANFGAFMAGKSDQSVLDGIRLMKKSPHFSDEGFTDVALQVYHMYTPGASSLAIPTWFYGHEPSNVFSPAIAKYFSNSIREDTLLAICIHGVIYAPGSAGTNQEIFMDLAQNHYATYDYYSPMIFLGTDHYEFDTTLFPVVRRLSRDKPFAPMIEIFDSEESIVEFIVSHPPIRTGS